ncbi:MAG: hypothetical protein IT477_03055 [Rhodanobacteraceae bacterium]|nr:hypothetical protein [Rhodanobacteraceae bacterium]MDL1868575.1 hypothetical protein [Gammaproteobacteria bacterium PRO6]
MPDTRARHPDQLTVEPQVVRPPPGCIVAFGEEGVVISTHEAGPLPAGQLAGPLAESVVAVAAEQGGAGGNSTLTRVFLDPGFFMPRAIACV